MTPATKFNGMPAIQHRELFAENKNLLAKCKDEPDLLMVADLFFLTPPDVIELVAHLTSWLHCRKFISEMQR